MKEKTNEFMIDLLKTLELDERITYLKNQKQHLLSNKTLMDKINKLKTLDIYSNEYKELKKDLFNDSGFVEYKKVENELNLLILEINQRLNKLTDERGSNICE